MIGPRWRDLGDVVLSVLVVVVALVLDVGLTWWIVRREVRVAVAQVRAINRVGAAGARVEALASLDQGVEEDPPRLSVVR
jgi:hypothetical protein